VTISGYLLSAPMLQFEIGAGYPPVLTHTLGDNLNAFTPEVFEGYLILFSE